VAVVRSLANEPAVVFADEPTGNLDSKSGRLVFDLMKRLSRESGTAFVMVTHDDNFALEADRVIRIRDGRLVGAPVGAPSGATASRERLADSILPGGGRA
jgi:ABC-type lipoprotein export system ATPase subunit